MTSDQLRVEPHCFEPLHPGPLTRAFERAVRDLPLFNADHDDCRHCLRPRRLHPVKEWSIARPV